MAKIDKKAIILQCIISEYIKTMAPVGSERLQSVINMEISSATIRNYFKQMVEEGVLVQFHVSGGRVPSALALRQFWSERLSKLSKVKIADTANIKEASREFKITSILKINESDRLLNVYLAGGRYVVAEFERGGVLLSGDSNTKAFLDECVGLDVVQIRDLAHHYGAKGILAKIAEYISSKNVEVANKEELLEIAKHDSDWAKEKMQLFLNGAAASQIGKGIYFKNLIPDGFMAVKMEAEIGSKSGEILYIGHLSRDFGRFLQALN